MGDVQYLEPHAVRVGEPECEYARLEKAAIAPAPQASPETLIRRLSLNLTGLPPTLAELDAFLSDPSPAAYGRAVDRYLASPAYGERMAMDWLDLARYADTYGYQADVERDISPYRDWVIRAFNDNLPYDEFLTWQLAGDLLPNATREQVVATAFNRLHRQTNEGGSIEEEFRTEYVADRVNTFSTAMLGLTMECARCHDHKFDAITQRDYFSMFAFFNNIDESGLYSHFTNATPSPSLLLWPAGKERQHGVLKARIAAVEAGLKHISRDARETFRVWLKTARVSPAAPIAHLAFDAVTGETKPDGVSETSAQVQDGVALVHDTPAVAGSGAALEFSGDAHVVHPGVRAFGRTDAFSFELRLKPTAKQDRAIILHQRGVKFIQLYHRGWDQHDNLPRDIQRQCRETDQASAALVTDLKQRGMLDDTLVIWGGEFGRTSYSQGKLTASNYGRDHHPRCFTIWMAGAGAKAGLVYGATDEFSYNVTEGGVHVHDFYATLLHLLGVDHHRLTYFHQGRRFRLTDVHGKVVEALLA